jgi:hypothetical protein
LTPLYAHEDPIFVRFGLCPATWVSKSNSTTADVEYCPDLCRFIAELERAKAALGALGEANPEIREARATRRRRRPGLQKTSGLQTSPLEVKILDASLLLSA